MTSGLKQNRRLEGKVTETAFQLIGMERKFQNVLKNLECLKGCARVEYLGFSAG